jgi:hypothetical protein
VAAALNKDLAVLDMSAVMGFETDGEIVELNIQPQDGESARSYTIDKRWENTVKCMKDLGYLK